MFVLGTRSCIVDRRTVLHCWTRAPPATSTCPTCIWHSRWVNPFESRKDFRHEKTSFPRLSCGIVCIILHLAVFVELRLVTDRQTHRHRQTQGRCIYRAEHSSCSNKNGRSHPDAVWDGRSVGSRDEADSVVWGSVNGKGQFWGQIWGAPL